MVSWSDIWIKGTSIYRATIALVYKEVPTLSGPLFLIFEEVIAMGGKKRKNKDTKIVIQQMKVRNPLNLLKTNPTP